MNRRRFSTRRFLTGLALMTFAWVSQAPSALASCACMCVDGAPYNVCTSGFTGQTQETTQECTTALAGDCPVPEPVPTTTPIGEQTGSDAVNVAGAHSGLDCRPRQVYRPDLAEHKVYTVCMPEKWVTAQTKRSDRKNGR